MLRLILVLLLTLGVAASGTVAQERPLLTQITGEATCTPEPTGQPDQAQPQTTAAQPPQLAKVKLLQTAMGRILEVENENIKARGRAVQVEDKRTGRVGYFLAYGGDGSISIIFGFTPNDQITAKLVIVGDANPTERYEYKCKKDE